MDVRFSRLELCTLDRHTRRFLADFSPDPARTQPSSRPFGSWAMTIGSSILTLSASAPHPATTQGCAKDKMHDAERQRADEQARRDHPHRCCDVTRSAASVSVFHTTPLSLTRFEEPVSRRTGAGAGPWTHIIDARPPLPGRMTLRLALLERRRPGDTTHGKKNVGRRIAPRGNSGRGRQRQSR